MKQQFINDNIIFDSLQTENSMKNGLIQLCHHSIGWANARDCLLLIKYLYESRAQRNSTGSSSTRSSSKSSSSSASSRVYDVVDVEYALNRLQSQRPLVDSLTPSASANIDSGLIFPRFATASDAQLPIATSSKATTSSTATTSKKRKSTASTAKDTAVATKAKKSKAGGDNDDMDPTFIALLEACREAGYDESHEKRKELVVILEAVQSGGAFPDDIMSIVLAKTQLSNEEATEILRPQVSVVLSGMKHAILVEDMYGEKIRELQESLSKATTKKERERIMKEITALDQKADEDAAVQMKLQQAGCCPMGFTWHPCGDGWRCAGGSHFLTAGQLKDYGV